MAVRPLLVVGLLSGIVSAIFLASILLWSQKYFAKLGTPEPKVRAMDILDTYSCPLSDKKYVFTHDQEDDYLFEGNEKSDMHPRLLELGYYRHFAEKPRVYDSKEMDRHLVGYFDVPSHISKGIFVVKMKPIGSSTTEFVQVGNLYASTLKHMGARSDNIGIMDQNPVWQVKQDVHVLDLAKAEIPNYGPNNKVNPSILDYINSGETTTVLDFKVSDDTAVDFVGLAVCGYPTVAMGATLTETTTLDLPQGLSFLAGFGDPLQNVFNPYRGDTHCSNKVPLACFNDNATPLPDNSPELLGLDGNWSQGEIKLTPAVNGDQFETREQAQQFCEQSFGKQWRLADGGLMGGAGIYSKADIEPGTKVWIDVKDQQYGNCWSRDTKK